MGDVTEREGRQGDSLRRVGGGAATRVVATLLGWVGAGVPDDPPPALVAIRVSRDHVASASAPARALFAEAARRGAPLALLRDRLARCDGATAQALDALMARGVAFRRRIQLAEGVFDLSAEPAGGDCLLVFTDISAHAAALAAAEAELAAAKAEAAALRAALDAVKAPVWRRTAQGEIIWVSAGARVLGGADPPEDAAIIPIAAADGDTLAVAAALTATPAPGAALNRFVETVTETFAHLRIGLAIYDSERRLTLANPAVAELFGADPAWFAARPTLRETLDRLREARQLPEQANYPAWRAQLFTLFDDVARASYEERWELPDGRSIHVVGRPHALGGIAFIFEDVTEAIAMQRWRSTAVEVRRATLDALADGVVVLGPDGQTRMANPAFVTLWRLGERFDDAPRHVSDIAAACRALIGDDPLWTRICGAVSGVGGRAPWSGRVSLANGRALMARIAPMPDGSTLAVFSDVTDSERIAQALRERADTLESAADMRNALLDQISHRLRTPLNAIMGFAELLLENRVGAVPPAQRSYLENIREASDGLLEGIESLADVVSTGSHAAGLQVGDVSLTAVLRGAAGLLERRLHERDAVIDLSAVPEDAAMRGDPARIRQMLFNMLAHAAAAAAPGEVLEVGAARRDGRTEIWCACSGLSAADAGSPSLTLARRAAELHGGEIVVTGASDGPGRILCRLADV